MRSDAMDALRAALRAFCPTGKETVTVPQLAEALGLTTESQKQLLRRRLLILATRGETEKVGRGVWLFIPGKEPSRRGKATCACGGLSASRAWAGSVKTSR